MEELLELRTLLLGGNISEALLLVEEMTEMSKDDKLNKVFSFSIILLMYLIKQQAEKKSTKSWETSIFNTVKQIQRSNKRRKAGGYYLTQAELRDTLEDAYESGLKQAALEVFEGRYESAELGMLVDREGVIQEAINLVSGGEG